MNRLADIFIDDGDMEIVAIIQDSIDKSIDILSKNRDYDKLIKFLEWAKYQIDGSPSVKDEPITGESCNATEYCQDDVQVTSAAETISSTELKSILYKLCDIYHEEWSLYDGITSISHIQPAIIRYCHENSINLGEEDKWREALSRAISDFPYLHKKAATNRVYLYSRTGNSDNNYQSSNGHQSSFAIHI